MSGRGKRQKEGKQSADAPNARAARSKARAGPPKPAVAKKQAKAAGDGGISDEVLRTSQEAFTEYDINKNGGIEVDEIGALLKALDLLKIYLSYEHWHKDKKVKAAATAVECKP